VLLRAKKYVGREKTTAGEEIQAVGVITANNFYRDAPKEDE